MSTSLETTHLTLLIAHGSRNPRSALAHAQLCESVQAASSALLGAPMIVRPAYLEITSPSISEAIDEAIAQGAGSIRLLPHFLGPGNHVLVDIPALAEEARRRHPGIHIELAEHLGADPALVELLARRVIR